jgi:hypothetical protein
VLPEDRNKKKGEERWTIGRFVATVPEFINQITLEEQALSPERQRARKLGNTYTRVGERVIHGSDVAKLLSAITRWIDYYYTMVSDESIKGQASSWRSFMSVPANQRLVTADAWANMTSAQVRQILMVILPHLSNIFKHSSNIALQEGQRLNAHNQAIKKEQNTALTGMIELAIYGMVNKIHEIVMSTEPKTFSNWSALKTAATQTLNKIYTNNFKDNNALMKNFWEPLFKAVGGGQGSRVIGDLNKPQNLWLAKIHGITVNEKVLPPQYRDWFRKEIAVTSDAERGIAAFTEGFAGFVARGLRFMRGIVKTGPNEWREIDIPRIYVPVVEDRNYSWTERIAHIGGEAVRLFIESAVAGALTAGFGAILKGLRGVKLFEEALEAMRVLTASRRAQTFLGIMRSAIARGRKPIKGA